MNYTLNKAVVKQIWWAVLIYNISYGPNIEKTRANRITVRADSREAWANDASRLHKSQKVVFLRKPEPESSTQRSNQQDSEDSEPYKNKWAKHSWGSSFRAATKDFEIVRILFCFHWCIRYLPRFLQTLSSMLPAEQVKQDGQ